MNHFLLEEKNFTILIVDDTESNVKLLSHVLREAGYNLIVAFNGEDAISLIHSRKPDLILCDVLMPDMTGYKVAEKVLSTQEFSSLPIIFITALTDLDDKLKGFEAGGVDFITKPFQKEEVLARIKTHLFLRQLLKERDSRIELLNKKEKELRNLSSRKEQLLRIVSHDIYNPLSGIEGISRLLSEDEKISDDSLELVDVISNSAQKLKQLVDKVLYDDSKLGSQNMLNVGQVHIEELIERIVELNSPKAVLKKIDLHYELVLEKKCFEFDEIKIEIAINNLLSNALKFTPVGGDVRIVVKEIPGNLQISVKDSGIGISEQKISEFYENETIANTSGTEGEKGSGLGLEVVREYIHLHNGYIKLNSKKNKGTEFIIEIPINQSRHEV